MTPLSCDVSSVSGGEAKTAQEGGVDGDHVD